MIFSRKHVRVIVVSLIVSLATTWNLTLVSSSSGGVMGGSFFDSDSSSSDSFTTESDSSYSDSFTTDSSYSDSSTTGSSYSSSFTTDSSYSRSFTTESDSEHVKKQHHILRHDVPSKDADDEVASGGRVLMVFFIIFVIVVFLVGFCNEHVNENMISVFKLQVGILAETGCIIQRDLTRIAQAANTSSKEGVSCLLKDTIQTLDQHHGYCTAGYSSVDHKWSKEDGEKCYNQLSNEERAKFDEETLVNLNNNIKTSRRSKSYDEYPTLDSDDDIEKFEKEKLLTGLDSKYIVVTVLVAAKGSHKLPNINRAEDLKQVLQKLKSLISSRYLFAGEVLWTPQEDDDTLSDRQLLKDYPQLAKTMNIFLVKKHE